jgi:spoIIIJ-associated protein
MATKKSTKTTTVQLITDATEEFVKDLGVTAEVTVAEEEVEGQPEYRVSLKGDDLGILIGFHGETLNGLQLLLSLIVSKKLGEWVRISLDAGDWRERRFETLQAMAERAIEKSLSSGEEVALPIMPSSDRRLVHIALKDHPEVDSESTGEEGYRRIVIRPK